MTEKRAELNISGELSKTEVIDAVDQWRFDLGLGVEEINGEKPWGAYWKIDKRYLGQFLKLFFPEMIGTQDDLNFNLSPKFLLVGPGEELSWQYHNRRTENWKVVAGDVSVKLSQKEEQPLYGFKFVAGDLIRIDKGEKHRLIGKYGWGLVAEVWKHSDPDNPSDEEDIVRLADDYGRAE